MPFSIHLYPRGWPGASAYEVAVENGFVGTEADWLASLQGAPGAAGDNGAPGDDGVGVPAGGTTGQVLAKTSGADYATGWVDAGSASSVAWDDVTGKPSTFPPSAHTHDDATTGAAGFMSAADKTKLDGIEAGAQVNAATDLTYTASTRVLASSTGTDATLPLVGADAGLMSAADKTKLDGVASGATANSSDATLLDRANHTGTQLAATISDFATAVAAAGGMPTGGTAGQVLQKVDGTNFNATWATPSGGGGSAGVHYLVAVPVGTQIDLSVNGTTAVTVAGVANRCDFVPFIPAKSLTISRFYIEVTTLLAASTALVGVYSDVNGVPTSLLVQGDAAADCGSIGQKLITISSGFTFTAGTVYWIACATSSTQTLRGIPTGAQYSIGMANTSGARAGFRRATLGSMSLPSTAPSTTLTNGSTPQVLLHRSA